jgi:hypothetical protein
MFFHLPLILTVKESSVRRVQCGVVAAVVIAMFAMGCGQGTKLLPASGTVTYQDKPLEGALVTFLGEGNVLGSGTTDAAGKYTISTLGRPGAVPGKNQVAISKTSGGSAAPTGMKAQSTPPTPEEIQKMQAEMKGSMQGNSTKQLLPAKYANPAASGFTADVQPGKSTFDFTLSD